MREGRIATAAMTDLDLPNVAHEADMDPAELEPVFPLLTSRRYIGVSKSTSPEVVRSLQAALDGMKQDGSFNQLVQKWAAHWKRQWHVKDGALQAK